MPRTKLDKYRLSRTELETKIIKRAAADKGFYTNVALAAAVGCDATYLSKFYKKGFSDKMKLRIHKALNFNQGEFQALFGIKDFGKEEN